MHTYYMLRGAHDTYTNKEQMCGTTTQDTINITRFAL